MVSQWDLILFSAVLMTAGCGSSKPVSGGSASSSASDVTVVLAPPVNVRPGPDVLYYPPAASPQLENVGIWQAEPIMISGAGAYRAGEFLYQDYLFDESGAYPDDPAYSTRNNADLVEVRLKPTASATAVRLTLNSLQDFTQVGATIALGGSATQPQAVPHGANARMPAKVFVTVHGTSGDIVDAATGARLPQAPQVSVDTVRRQIDVLIPYAAFDPRGQTIRVGAAVGLWDAAADAYRPQSAGAAFMNVAFRYSEPVGPGYPPDFSNAAQSAAVAAGDLSPFYANVDFAKLVARTDDDMPGQTGGVPQTGQMARIYASHFEQQQGRGPGAVVGGLPGPPETTICKQPCSDDVVDYPGQLQPYTLDVPTGPAPANGYALAYALHGCGQNYKPGPVSQLHANALQALVVYPEGRGPCHWYWNISGADVFEAVGDVMRRYPINNDLVYIAGGSMGGYGTYRFSAEWPDLFAALAPIIGCTAASTGWTGPPAEPEGGQASTIHPLAAAWRNLPILSDFGLLDTTCNESASRLLFDIVDQLGYRYEWREYPGEHSTSALEAEATSMSQWDDFFRGKQVVHEPAHVSYVYNLLADQRDFGLNVDHAYWLSSLAARDLSGEAPMGTIDVFSHGFGIGDPPANPTESTVGPGYTGKRKTWGDVPAIPVEDMLDVVAKNISAVTIDVARARVSCSPTLHVTSDGPITITLAGCQ